MNNKVKILYFVDRMLRGGIQSLLIEWIKRIDKEKFQIDFLLLDDGNEYELEKELKEYGCKIFKLESIWIKNIWDYIPYNNKLHTFFKENNDYDIIHFHSSSKNYLVLKWAKIYGIKHRISHSHNVDFQTSNIIKKKVGDILKTFLKKYSTFYVACSENAGVWLFGKNCTKQKNFMIIHNAINLEKFIYNEKVRKKIREKLDYLNTDIIIGNVARFTNQKNHKFLIKIYRKLQKQDSRFKLLLIGTGEKEPKIRKLIKKYKLEDSIKILGFKENVNDYMQAMDMFVLPSKFEGLGIVLIEAQANGMTCLASENVIPIEAKVIDSFKFLNLKKEQEWIKYMLTCKKNRTDTRKDIVKAGYDIEENVKIIQDLYLDLKEDRK